MAPHANAPRAKHPRPRPAVRSARAALLLSLSLLLLAMAGLPQQAVGSRDPDAPTNPLPCDCSDVDPRDDFTKVSVPYSCWEQSNFKDVCSQDFMLHTPEEVPEGYCQISCGRCTCCSTFAQILKDKAPEFLWLLNATEFGQNLAKPGYAVVLLVPHDDAVHKLLSKIGYSSRQQVERDKNAKAKLTQIAKQHILPPTGDINALWSTPFMRGGAKLYTQEGKYLTAETGGDGKVKVSGPANSAYIYEQDINVCKGYINMIDTALAPQW